MQWLSQNGVWIALIIGFIALHFVGHGGHRHGRGHGHHGRRDALRSPPRPNQTSSSGSQDRSSNRDSSAPL